MSDIFTLDENNNAAVRTVSVKAGATESNQPDIFTTDENGNAAVRVMGGAGSVNLDEVIIKSADIPTASADVLGQMYCFDGETNANYTHGYVYECVESSTYYVANIAFEQSTFASESFEKAGQLIVDAGVSDPTEVTGGTMTYALAGNLWSIVFTDENGNDLNTPYSIYTEDLEQDYDILPVIDPSDFVDEQVVSMTINNVSEEQGYVWERINLQPETKLGRYLSSWNCATGLAGTNPPVSPYTYTTGDYFIVSAVATGGASNYKPNGSSYTTGQASTTVETNPVQVNDTYFYDGTNWTLLKTGSAVSSVNGQTGDVSLKTINGNTLTGSGNVQISGFLPFPAGWTTNSTTKALCDDIAADATTVKGSAFLGEVTCSDLPASIANSEINVYINDGTTAANKVIILELTSGNVSPYRWIYVYWNGGSSTSGWKTWQETLVSGVNIKTVNGTSLLGSGNIATEAIQVATMPTAGADELGKVYQFIGTTDANYIHGYFYECVSDGQNPATYSWAQTDVQPGGSSLPSQTGNAGKFLTTDGTNTSWSYTVGNTLKINSGNGSRAIEIPGSNANQIAFIRKTVGGLGFGYGEGSYSKDFFCDWQNKCFAPYNWETDVTLGRSGVQWGNIYVKKINNGADIAIPTTGGTLALTSDLPSAPATMPTLAVADWSSNTQTVTVQGVTASNIVFVSPAPASAADYAAAGIVCTSQSTDSLTFTCTTVPTNAITVNVVILG